MSTKTDPIPLRCHFCRVVFNASAALVASGMPIKCQCRPGAIGGSGLFDGASAWSRVSNPALARSVT